MNDERPDRRGHPHPRHRQQQRVTHTVVVSIDLSARDRDVAQMLGGFQANASKSRRPSQKTDPGRRRGETDCAGTFGDTRHAWCGRRRPRSRSSVAQRPTRASRASGSGPSRSARPGERRPTSGNAHRANEISRRRARFPSMTSFPRHDPRGAAPTPPAGEGPGDSANTSGASDNTSASITSDLSLPEIAPLNRAECRVPDDDRSQPARCNAT